MITVSFGMKKSGIHKDKVRLSWDFVSNDTNGEMSIEKCPSLFGSGIEFVIGVSILVITIDRTAIAIVVVSAPIVAVAVVVVIVVAVAVFIAYCAGIIVNVAARTDCCYSIAVTSPLPIMATIIGGLVRILSVLRGFDDRHGLKGLYLAPKLAWRPSISQNAAPTKTPPVKCVLRP